MFAELQVVQQNWSTGPVGRASEGRGKVGKAEQIMKQIPQGVVDHSEEFGLYLDGQ